MLTRLNLWIGYRFRMSDEQNFPPPPMPTPGPAPTPSAAPSPAPAPQPSFDQFAPPTAPVGGQTPPPNYGAAPASGGGGGNKKTGLIIGIVAVVIAAGVGAFLLLGGKDDKKADDKAPVTVSSSDETMAPDDDSDSGDSDDSGGSGGGSGGLAVGEEATVPEGVVRVNSVETNVDGIDQYSPPMDGMSYTRVEVEACGTGERLESGWSEWDAYLDNGEIAELSFTNSESPMFTLGQGDCARGYLVFSVPSGSDLTEITFTEFWSDETATWDLTSETMPVNGPLRESGKPGNEIGSSFTFDSGLEVTILDGGNYTSTDEFFELPAGRKLVAANVRLCGGSELTTIYPSDFYVLADDGFFANNEFYNTNLESTDLNPGDCVEGGVVFMIPENSSVATILYKEFMSGQIARWTI